MLFLVWVSSQRERERERERCLHYLNAMLLKFYVNRNFTCVTVSFPISAVDWYTCMSYDCVMSRKYLAKI